MWNGWRVEKWKRERPVQREQGGNGREKDEKQTKRKDVEEVNGGGANVEGASPGCKQ